VIDLYGIPNCDTVKKARKWLEAQGIEYVFHDFKKEAVTPSQLQNWIDQAGLEVVLNKRGTTWRNLPDEDKQDIDTASAIELLIKQPSMIKRPVLMRQDGSVLIGFKPEQYASLFDR
jgi:Spx/MgsR family transcriptional regulator